jgi:hypothetical protein
VEDLHRAKENLTAHPESALAQEAIQARWDFPRGDSRLARVPLPAHPRGLPAPDLLGEDTAPAGESARRRRDSIERGRLESSTTGERAQRANGGGAPWSGVGSGLIEGGSQLGRECQQRASRGRERMPDHLGRGLSLLD